MHSENPNDTTQAAPQESADVAAYRATLADHDARFGATDIEQLSAIAGDGLSLRATAEPGAGADALPDWAPPLPQLGEQDPFAAPVTLSEEEKWAAVDAPAARPEDYQVPPVSPEFGEPTAESLAEARGLQSLLYAAAMPKADGEALLVSFADAARRQPDPPGDAEFELTMQQTHQQLRRTMGDTEFERCQAALSKLKDGVAAKLPANKREAFEDYLEQHAHVLANPLVLHKLLVHAGRGRSR